MNLAPTGFLWQGRFYHLKFIHEKFKKSFLDVVIKFNEDKVINDIRREPMNSCQYHHFVS